MWGWSPPNQHNQMSGKWRLDQPLNCYVTCRSGVYIFFQIGPGGLRTSVAGHCLCIFLPSSVPVGNCNINWTELALFSFCDLSKFLSVENNIVHFLKENWLGYLKMSLLLTLGGHKVEKLKKTKWCFVGHPVLLQQNDCRS